MDAEVKRHVETWHAFVKGSTYIAGFVILVLVLLAIFVV